MPCRYPCRCEPSIVSFLLNQCFKHIYVAFIWTVMFCRPRLRTHCRRRLKRRRRYVTTGARDGIIQYLQSVFCECRNRIFSANDGLISMRLQFFKESKKNTVCRRVQVRACVRACVCDSCVPHISAVITLQ